MFGTALVVTLIALAAVLPYLVIPCALGAWIHVARLRRTPEHQPALRAKPGESPAEALRVLRWVYRLYGCALLVAAVTWVLLRFVPGGTAPGLPVWLTLPVAAVPAPRGGPTMRSPTWSGRSAWPSTWHWAGRFGWEGVSDSRGEIFVRIEFHAKGGRFPWNLRSLCPCCCSWPLRSAPA